MATGKFKFMAYPSLGTSVYNSRNVGRFSLQWASARLAPRYGLRLFGLYQPEKDQCQSGAEAPLWLKARSTKPRNTG